MKSWTDYVVGLLLSLDRNIRNETTTVTYYNILIVLYAFLIVGLSIVFGFYRLQVPWTREFRS